MIIHKFNYVKESNKHFKDVKPEKEEENTEGYSKKQLRIKKMMERHEKKSLKNHKLVYSLKKKSHIHEKFTTEKVGTNEFNQDVFAFVPSKKYESI